MLTGVTNLLDRRAEVKRLIGEHQGSFGLLGYSQGGAVVSLVGRELVSGTIDWFDYCLPGDIYGNADIFGTYLKQGYDLVTPLSLVDPFTMIARIAANIARWLQTGELGPLIISRAIKTGFDLGAFLRENPHDKYGVWQIIPGRTALQHSANHRNFWGPRLPDFVDVTLSML